ncbi:helix-turn-helix transcriptional regulator [Aeromicrobium sp.]|uniref:helix-turn-helix transcriptional regulator n=1 Tax=Aeromicrobium sp. TaxID=1871063 RepID=UPI003D6AB3AF
MRKQATTEWPRPLPPKLWNIHETAEFLGVPTSTLYYWSYIGEGGPRILRIGKSLRYNPYDVAEWARSESD